MSLRCGYTHEASNRSCNNTSEPEGRETKNMRTNGETREDVMGHGTLDLVNTRALQINPSVLLEGGETKM